MSMEPRTSPYFTIENLGVGDLRLTSAPLVQITGPGSNDFSVVVQPDSVVPASDTTEFRLVFRPVQSGLRTATVVIPNNDPEASPYTFAIEGRAFYRLEDAHSLPMTHATDDVVYATSGSGWMAVALRNISGDRGMAASTTPDWTTLYQTSAVAGAGAEFIAVAPGSATPNHYARITGDGSCLAEMKQAEGILSLGGTTWSLPVESILKPYNVVLTAGHEYYFAADPLSGGDVSLFVLRPSRISGSRSDYDWGSDSQGPGGREWVAFTAPESGWYGVVVIGEPENSTYWMMTAEEALPDMWVHGNNHSIASGTTNWSSLSQTLFPETATLGSFSRTFTIRNDGYKDLALTGTPAVQIEGLNIEDFSVTQMPSTSVGLRGGTTPFTVTFHPRARGFRQATVVIPSSQADKDPYTFVVGGWADASLMEVNCNGTVISNSPTLAPCAGANDFGQLTCGLGHRARDFVIHSHGDIRLGLTGTPLVDVAGENSDDFVVDTAGLNTLIQPGNSTSFRVTFQPQEAGQRQALIRIPSDDPGGNPYEFPVQGEGVVPEIAGIRLLESSQLELRWMSVWGARYAIRSADTVDGDFADWVAQDIAASPPTNSAVIQLNATNTARFYRVEVQSQQ